MVADVLGVPAYIDFGEKRSRGSNLESRIRNYFFTPIARNIPLLMVLLVMIRRNMISVRI
jgi:hypothetical protein